MEPAEDEGEQMVVDDDDVEMVMGDDDADGGDEAPAGNPVVWDPAKHPLEEDEELDYDRTAYKVLHELGVEWPSLSFDLVADSLGFMRKTWPQTMLMVTGSQVML
jgi:ribosome assembly protein RRB1